ATSCSGASGRPRGSAAPCPSSSVRRCRAVRPRGAAPARSWPDARARRRAAFARGGLGALAPERGAGVLGEVRDRALLTRAGRRLLDVLARRLTLLGGGRHAARSVNSSWPWACAQWAQQYMAP